MLQSHRETVLEAHRDFCSSGLLRPRPSRRTSARCPVEPPILVQVYLPYPFHRLGHHAKAARRQNAARSNHPVKKGQDTGSLRVGLVQGRKLGMGLVWWLGQHAQPKQRFPQLINLDVMPHRLIVKGLNQSIDLVVLSQHFLGKNESEPGQRSLPRPARVGFF